MASNGLVANVSKTVFMILNLTKAEAEAELAKEIEIDGVCRYPSTRLQNG